MQVLYIFAVIMIHTHAHVHTYDMFTFIKFDPEAMPSMASCLTHAGSCLYYIDIPRGIDPLAGVLVYN